MAKSLYRIENIRLAELLRELRVEGQMVQSDLAMRIGRNQTYVSNVELAIRRLDLVELRDYCEGLGVSLLDLVRRWEAAISAKPTRARARKASPAG